MWLKAVAMECSSSYRTWEEVEVGNLLLCVQDSPLQIDVAYGTLVISDTPREVTSPIKAGEVRLLPSLLGRRQRALEPAYIMVRGGDVRCLMDRLRWTEPRSPAEKAALEKLVSTMTLAFPSGTDRVTEVVWPDVFALANSRQPDPNGATLSR